MLDHRAASSWPWVMACTWPFLACGSDAAEPERFIELRSATAMQCPTGGTVVLVGVDADRNGTLADSEVEQQATICDGRNGSSVLIRTAGEPPGTECPTGGIRVEAGPDLDGSGELEPGEVRESRQLCNGADGRPHRIEIETEVPGDNCGAGGSRIRSGIDLDGNEVLDAEEVEFESYVCQPLASLVRITEEPAGAACAEGGTAVEVGLDTDNDGELSDEEVSGRRVVCDGVTGDASLVAVVVEPAGERCEAGGSRIETGRDDNGNAQLDPEEVSLVSYVCSGDAGADGDDGSLVRVSTEPVGANCTGGGLRVDTGPDLDDDGVLDSNEIVESAFACNGSSNAVLVDSSPVAEGADCSEGGTRVKVGVDANANGILEESEVSTSFVVCNGQASVPFAIQTGSLPDGRRSESYSAAITAAGGTGGGYAWTVSAGMLPPGLALGASGTPSTTLAGIPTAAGTYTFTLRVSDVFGQITERGFTLLIEGADLAIATHTVPRPESGTPYSFDLLASGGRSPYRWSLTSGTLPAGLALSTNGRVSGTPTSTVGSTVLVEVADADGDTQVARLRFLNTPRWVAFTGDTVTNGTTDVSIVNIEGGTPGTPVVLNKTPVAGGGVEADSVQFSDNGEWLGFIGDLDTADEEELWVVDVSGATPGTAVKVNAPFTGQPADEEYVQDFYFAADGDFVVYSKWLLTPSFTSIEFFIHDLRTGSTARNVSPTGQVFQGEDVVISPDGNTVAFSGYSGSDHGFWVVDATSSSAKPVRFALAGLQDLEDFAFGPDSDELFYTDASRNLSVVDISTLASTGSIGTSLTISSTITGRIISVSPDETTLAFDRTTELSVVDLSATPRRLRRIQPGPLSRSSVADWTVDSRGLMRDGSYIDRETGDETEIFPPTTGFDDRLEDLVVVPSNVGLVFRSQRESPTVFDAYLARYDDPGNPTRLSTNISGAEDVNSLVVSPDGDHVLYSGDANGAGIDELFVIDISGATPTAPTRVNEALVVGGDVLDDKQTGYAIVGDYDGVVYIADQDTDDVFELYLRWRTGGALDPAVTVSPTLPADGDVESVFVQP